MSKSGDLPPWGLESRIIGGTCKHSLADQLEGHPYLSERALCAAWGENTSHLGGCDRGWMTVNCHLAEAGFRAFRQRVQLEQGHAGWEEARRVGRGPQGEKCHR